MIIIQDDIKKNRNSGVSLVELIVVISIMAIMIGLVSISVSLMFSRDAESAAKVIDDELTEARMLSMSRQGKFILVINPSDNTVVINKVGDTEPLRTVNYKKNVSLTVKKPSVATPDDISSAYEVEFDKRNGSVYKIGGSVVDTSSSGVYSITATTSRLLTKTATVDLVTTTGRHYVRK